MPGDDCFSYSCLNWCGLRLSPALILRSLLAPRLFGDALERVHGVFLRLRAGVEGAHESRVHLRPPVILYGRALTVQPNVRIGFHAEAVHLGSHLPVIHVRQFVRRLPGAVEAAGAVNLGAVLDLMTEATVSPPVVITAVVTQVLSLPLVIAELRVAQGVTTHAVIILPTMRLSDTGTKILLAVLILMFVLSLVVEGEPSNWTVLLFLIAAWLDLRQRRGGRRHVT